MAKIHMETEEVRMVARMLNQKVDELLDHEHNLKRAAGKASSAWYGGSKPTKYHKNLKSWLSSFENQISQLQNLSMRLNHEVDEWELADRNGNSSWKNISSTIPATMGIGAAAVVAGNASNKFDWYKTGSKTVTAGLAILKRVPVDKFKSVKLANIIKNPGVQKGVPYVLGVVGDLLKGDRLDRALGSEAIELAAGAGLPFVIGGAIGGAVGLIGGPPGALAGATIGAGAGVKVYFVYQMSLAAGYIFSGVLEVAGFEKEALGLQNFLEPFDIGERIGNSLYDAAYDFIVHPNK